MATNTGICGICSLRQITKTSTHWCLECEEAICDECKEHHTFLKATRSHELISISNFKSLPSFICDIQQTCINHNVKYQQYCTEHAFPICFKCIKDHQKCTVIPLEEVTTNVKTSDQFQDIETRLVDLLENVNRINKDRKDNAASIKESKKRHLVEFQQIRLEINKHLDHLEKQMIKDLEEKEYQCNNSIQKVLSTIKEKETIITQWQFNFQSIKQYASDLQTFIGIREIEEKVNEYEQYLQSLIEDKSFLHLELVCKVDISLQNILNSFANFGAIEIESQTSTIELGRASKMQAQMQVANKAKQIINDMNLILQKKIISEATLVRGCCMSRYGELLFTDHVYKRLLCKISSDGTLKYSMRLDPGDGFDITFVDEKTVAITSIVYTSVAEQRFRFKEGVTIINLKNGRKTQFIELPGRTYGITCYHDSLFVCVKGCGIFKVDTVDYTSSHVIKCDLPWLSYVSVFNDKIYYTNDNEHSVLCCDHNGSLIWTFKNDSVLRLPRGIVVDNDGTVFVTGELSSNVVIISKDGKHHKEILTKQDGIIAPFAICLNNVKRELLIANSEKIFFLFNIT
ncbi:unnamed protein product [Mytilus coruscus]|uniref:B box-type domain-containing protein n=1 Tax=Mytilus coruscus TaxID=42192 RepID=A0A6J8AK63_MYTCO|nr:unnamed protein product [Mytilus coruscus]